MCTPSFTTQFDPAQPAIDLRAIVAARLGLERAELTHDSEPFRLGLDSLDMMSIVNQVRRAGVAATFEELVQFSTIGEWEALALRRSTAPSAPLQPASVDETAPFGLAPMQHAYWAGRMDEQELGGVATHLYTEFDGQEVDPRRLERAVRDLTRRHGMLRASFGDDGTQRILETSPWPGLTVHDLRDHPSDQVEHQLDAIRDTTSHRALSISAGEVFDVALSLLPSGATRLHVNLDMIAADAASFRVLMADLASLYDGQRLPELSYSYPRYLADRRRAQEQPLRASARERDRAWWQDRLADFPGAPDLPRERSEGGPARVRRHHHWLDPQAKDRITCRARERGLTLAMVLATAFAEALGGWSGEPRFMLNLPLFDREDLDPGVAGLVGDFSSTILLAADVTETLPFGARAEHLQRELRAALSHAAYPGVDVLRDLSREAGGDRVLAPVVYTSALNLGELFDDIVRQCFGTPVWIISQGPQVWLDAQVTELDGGILVNWDVREDVFPAGVIEVMFAAYRKLVDRLVTDDDVWDEPVGDLRPAAQRERHAATNATAAPQRLTRLHEGFFEHARSAPERAAVHWMEDGQPRTMSYGDLAAQALAVSATLLDNGLHQGGAVAITLPMGPAQVVAVLGVLAAGGVYVPVGTDQPMQRRRAIHKSSGVGWLLTTTGVDADDLPGAPAVLDIAQCLSARPLTRPIMPEPDEAAYVLFTSGSSGSPKGVEITHRGATNTIEDLNERFGIGASDRVLAVSALNFDLSVYDIFGLLAVGGAVVVTREDQRRDAEGWLELWEHFPVTVWNSVPILLDMLLTAAEPDPDLASRLADLRLVMLGGDWVGLDLPGRLHVHAPDCLCAVLGGATEASIQSLLYEVDQVDRTWRSIPYGHPLRNQQIRVVDAQERDRPDLAVGELWLGGRGVGGRYRGDDELTADRFVTRAGERWYRTGDLVRRRLDGELEIIGRTDFQVKIAGNRIDLGEVEAAVRADDRVQRAVAVALTDGDGPPRLGVLVAAGEHAAQDGLVELLVERAAQALPSSMMPDHVAVIAELPLSANGKIDRRAVRELLTRSGTARSAYDPPQGVLETAVAQAWAQVLHVDRVGRDDDFFRLGGDSLTATRSVALLRGLTLAEGDRVGGVRLDGLLQERTVAAFATTLHLETTSAPTDAGPVLRPDPDARYQPFDLTEVQQAYLLGRDETVPLGGIGANFYLELDGPALDEKRWCKAWQRLIDRHDMLRAAIRDGQQHVLESVEPYVPVTRTAEDSAAASALLQRLRHRTFDLATWPAFETETVQYGEGRARVGLVIDPAIFDGLSVKTILAELATTYADPGAELPAPGMTFRDYVTSVRPSGQELVQAEAYWTVRLDDLPAGPALPLAADPATMATPRFERRAHRMPTAAWTRVKDQARELGLTPSAVLLTSYAGVLSRWSAQPDLTLNLTVFDRRAVHADIDQVVGDFSSLLLLEHRPVADATWLSTARTTQGQLTASLEHRAFSAVQVQQRLAQRDGLDSAVFPVVFTSTLGVGGGLFDGAAPDFPAVVDGGSQTPQVWLDHQVVEQDGALLLSWDSVQGLFPDGLLDAMFAAYVGQLEHLAHSADWDLSVELLGQDQRDVRTRVNATGEPSGGSLHASFFEIARLRPDTFALFWGQDEHASYGQLAAWALRVAAHLQQEGVRPGDTVGVSLPKGPDQIVAVLGVLAAGGVYVPIGIDQPAARRERIVRAAGIRHLLTDLRASTAAVPSVDPHLPDPEAPAYIVFTSGSTGEPKGVQMSHQAAANTIRDISQRFGIGADDRVLAVSALEFDLSVYDIFGLLGAGGALVLVGEDERRDPDAWHRLSLRHGVTVWNTVPMLLDMFVTAAGWQSQVTDTLRLALVSGDWVGLNLQPRLRDVLPQCRLIAMGGATEAGIWSNHFEVGPPLSGWSSVPYGLPLGAQRFRVVDTLGRDCPDWVPGELWIGGSSLADGYRGDPDRTATSFPTVDGERWYRTGDIGRYRPGGLLEFLGRRDTQVKVRGHRIELGEIEAVLTEHPAVRQVLPILLKGNTTRIGAVVVGDLDASTVARQAAAHLPAAMVPDRIVVVPHLPSTANGKVDRCAAVALLGGDDLGLVGSASESANPAVLDRVSRTWSQVLGIEQVGPQANFFALGGDSLAATRVVALLRAPDVQTGEALTGAGVGVLFARPVLADFAAALRFVTTETTTVTVVADVDARYEPFPLTEVQQAYLRGRATDMPLGGIGTTYFLEFAGETLDVDRWQDAWRRLIERHDMLRIVIKDGQQRVLRPDVASSFEVSAHETHCAASASEILRASLRGRSFALDQWPAYDTLVVRHPDGVRVGVVVDYLPLDGRSVHLLLSELAALYADPVVILPDLHLTFRDYVLAHKPPPSEVERSRSYWNDRLGTLPPAPQLPVACDPATLFAPRFTRREERLDAQQWTQAKEWGRAHAVTPSAVLLACYATVLSRWSTRADLTLNLTLFDRRDVHPQVGDVLGDFTTLLLLEHRPIDGEDVVAAARRLQAQLASDLDHRSTSAVWVQRELARRTTPAAAAMPVVFTSTLGMSDDLFDDLPDGFPEFVAGASQTPQVWLDHQVMEQHGQLVYHWDAAEDLFDEGTLDEMFAAYRGLINALPAADLHALPSPSRTAPVVPATPVETGRTARTPPCGAVEERVARVWSQLLDVDEVHREDSFFALGGDSLLATRLMARLIESGIDGITMADLFARPALRDVCADVRIVEDGPRELHRLRPDLDAADQPFEATDVQRAYWVGRHGDITLGGVGAYYYSEFDGEDVDLDRMERVWEFMVDRHAELRSVFTAEGQQRLLSTDAVPAFRIGRCHVEPDVSDEQVDVALDELRKRMSHQVFDPSRWPLFDVQAVTYRRDGRDRARIGVGLDNIVLDGLSMMILFSEVEALYRDPEAELPSRAPTFRDYRTHVRPKPVAVDAARSYWRERLDDLPSGPRLPFATDPAELGPPRFVRHEHRIAADEWRTVKSVTAACDLTPAVLLLSCYAEVLSRWSAEPDLTFTLTLFDRHHVHPEIDAILGDFTSLLILAYRTFPGDRRLDRARRLRDQLARDLAHRDVSAVWVQREQARRTGAGLGGAAVVFTSGLGLGGGMSIDPSYGFPQRVWGISQTPQVWLDQQVSETPEGDLIIHWDTVDGLIPADVREAMFTTYCHLVRETADPGWASTRPGKHVDTNWSYAAGALGTKPAPTTGEVDDGPPLPGTEQLLASIWTELLDAPRVTRASDFFALGGDSLLATRMVAEVHQRLAVELTLREVFLAPTLAATAARCESEHEAASDLDEGDL